MPSQDDWLDGALYPDVEPQQPQQLPVLGTSRDLLALVQARQVDDVVMTITHHMQGELFQARWTAVRPAYMSRACRCSTSN